MNEQLFTLDEVSAAFDRILAQAHTCGCDGLIMETLSQAHSSVIEILSSGDVPDAPPCPRCGGFLQSRGDGVRCEICGGDWWTAAELEEERRAVNEAWELEMVTRGATVWP